MNAGGAQQPSVRFGRIAPVVPVTSIGKALDFYCGMLGFEKIFENGVRIVKGLRDADFGLRCFVFADPDGNRFDVGQPI